jgi:hypothetical protein
MYDLACSPYFRCSPRARHSGAHGGHRDRGSTRDGTDTFVDVLTSCGEDAPLYEITIDYNLIEHTTTFEDGRVHATFTQTGKFVAEALEPGSLDASGTFAIWGGFNANGKTVNGTFTFNLSGKYSDGSKVGIHVVDHFNTTPTGAEFFFTHCKQR